MKADPTPRAAIDAMPLFGGVSESGLRRLLAGSVVQRVSAGQVLFDQGDKPKFQLIVLAGAVQLLGRSTNGQEMIINIAESPNLLLPAAVASGAPYLMRARSIADARLLKIKADTFRSLVADEPMLALKLIQCLSDQFRAMVRQIKTLKFQSASQRVAAYLLALSRRQFGMERLVLPYEKGLIASQLGMTRESFSRALGSLQDDVIHVCGQHIEIRDWAALHQLGAPDSLVEGLDQLQA